MGGSDCGGKKPIVIIIDGYCRADWMSFIHYLPLHIYLQQFNLPKPIHPIRISHLDWHPTDALLCHYGHSSAAAAAAAVVDPGLRI